MSSAGVTVEPATVVLPTIGRPELVRRCLESLAECRPRAAEILVVDSSPDGAVAEEAARFAHLGTRVVRCDEPGLGTAFNVGLRAAAHDTVLLTNDDCTVDPSWVGVGATLLAADPDVIVTGRVAPHGDPAIVPSCIDDPLPHRYTGEPRFALYTQSMALRRGEVLAFGGFDGRIRPSAEDNDLSYRWLRAGRSIAYEPSFVVWHHDWRTPEQLNRLYVAYGVGQGMLYGKLLRSGDPGILRFVTRDLRSIARGVAARALRRPRWPGDGRLPYARGLAIGIARGLRLGR